MAERRYGILRYPTFNIHFKKRRHEGCVSSEEEYEKAIIKTIKEGDVYYLKDKAERESMIFFHPFTRWVVIVKECQIIATAFVLYESFPTIEDYLSKKGFYLYINMRDEADSKTHA